MPKQKPLFTRDGHLNDEGVALYVDALKLERTRELPRETRMHVSECQRCRREITGLFALLTDADYGAGVPHPFFERGSRQERSRGQTILRAAAVVGVLIGGALVVYYLSTGPVEDGPATAQRTEGSLTRGAPTTPERSRLSSVDTGAQLFAEHFAELPEYEDLVNGAFRAGSMQVLSPGIGDVVTDPVVFRWRTEIQGRVYLEILNNREEVVHSGEVGTLPYVVQRPATPGLYYWKLVGKEELLFVGKFLVRE